MQFSNEKLWDKEARKNEKDLLLCDSSNYDLSSDDGRQHFVYASGVAEITEGLIDSGLEPKRAIGVAAMAAYLSPVEDIGYAIMYDKMPHGYVAEKSIDLLEKTWEYGHLFTDLGAYDKHALAHKISAITEVTNAVPWSDAVELARKNRIQKPALTTGVQVERPPLLVSLDGPELTSHFMRSGYWAKKLLDSPNGAKGEEDPVHDMRPKSQETALVLSTSSDKGSKRPSTGPVPIHYPENVFMASNPYDRDVIAPSPLEVADMYGDANSRFIITKCIGFGSGFRSGYVHQPDRYIMAGEDAVTRYRPAFFVAAKEVSRDPEVQAILPQVIKDAVPKIYDPGADYLLNSKFGSFNTMTKLKHAFWQTMRFS